MIVRPKESRVAPSSPFANSLLDLVLSINSLDHQVRNSPPCSDDNIGADRSIPRQKFVSRPRALMLMKASRHGNLVVEHAIQQGVRKPMRQASANVGRFHDLVKQRILCEASIHQLQLNDKSIAKAL